MAISICFGLLAATVLTLLYVPALYLIVRDIRNAVISRFTRSEEEFQSVKDDAHPGIDTEHVAEDRG
jgi:hypothetical protein